MPKNRNPVKSQFITFPKSNLTKKEFATLFMPKKPTYIKCVEEKHKDGTPHLHMIIQYTAKFSCGHIVKYVKEKLPDDFKRIDVATVRSIKHSEVYLSKEDKEPYIYGEMTEGRNPRNAVVKSYLKEVGFSGTPAQYVKHMTLSNKHKDLLKDLNELVIANAMNEWKLLSYSDIQLFDYCMRHDDMPHIEPHIDYLLRIFRNVGKYESAKVANKFCLKSLEENLKIQNDK